MDAVPVFVACAALAVVNERIVEAISRPLFANVPVLKPYAWTLFYVALVTGCALGWLAELNGFTGLGEVPPVVGRIITAVVIGGGSSLVHELLPDGKDKSL